MTFLNTPGALMHEILNMLLAVYDRAALMLICLFFLIRIRLFRELLHKSAHTPKELLAVTVIFSMFAIFSTWSGVPVEGSLVNVRVIAVMSGGILFGPWVGGIVGIAQAPAQPVDQPAMMIAVKIPVVPKRVTPPPISQPLMIF